MSERPLMSLDLARAQILADLGPLASEEVALSDALGRILATDTHSHLTLPPWDNSAMDGFAVRSQDVAGASDATPVRLAVSGEVAAGHAPSVVVEEGRAVRILTGGILPAGADAVVAVEDTDAAVGVAALPADVSVRLAVAPGRHIRRRGSDLMQDQALLKAGTRVSPAAIAALAASGHAEVSVHRQPRIAVIATGDELVPLGQELGPASIPDSNSESISAQAAAAGADVIRLGIARDDHASTRALFEEGIKSADVLVATGGVSVGAHDVVKDVFEEVGSLDLWRVAIQPGKPLAHGHAVRPDGGTCILFGLPGNPVSSFVTFELFVRPVLRRLRGETDLTGRVTISATLTDPLRSSAGRRTFVRVRLEPDADASGRYRASMAGSQGSHVLSSLALADGLAVIPEDETELAAGTEVEVIRLDVELA